MSIPQLNTWILSLNRNEKELLKDIKDILKSCNEFFVLQYIQDSSNQVEFESKCKIILSQGYDFFFKINSLLEILHIIDESQTNKYRYEESIQFIPSMLSFMESIHDIYICKDDVDIQKYISLSMIEKNTPTLSESFKESSASKKSLLLYEKVNIFNHYINQYLLLIVKITHKLKNTYIS